MAEPCYADEPVRGYLMAAASGQPTPGGGSVAAMAGALAATMASMVANFTVGRQKYAAVQEEVGKLLEGLSQHIDDLTRLIDEDVKAYGLVSAAYKMPKETDGDRTRRSLAIAEACESAMHAPLQVALLCAEVSESACRLAQIGNKNLITDAGVSVLLCQAAAEAAAMNVEINLSSIEDASLAQETRENLQRALRTCEENKGIVCGAVSTALY